MKILNWISEEESSQTFETGNTVVHESFSKFVVFVLNSVSESEHFRGLVVSLDDEEMRHSTKYIATVGDVIADLPKNKFKRIHGEFTIRT